MADETHKLQKDPPEGSRKVIEHELERQSGKASDAGAKKAEDRPRPDRSDDRTSTGRDSR